MCECNEFFERNKCSCAKKDKKQRPHADIIKAWADGAEIQFKNNGFGGYEWRDAGNMPLFIPSMEYRIKPVLQVTSAFYRLYIDMEGKICIFSNAIKFCNSSFSRNNVDRWVGGWQEVKL